MSATLPPAGNLVDDQAALQAILRSDFGFFVRKAFQSVAPGEPYLPNWHVEAIAWQLERVLNGTTSRLLINQPPRSLKSICVSVAFVAWLLGHDPTRRIIVVSYSSELAAELHRQFRAVVRSAWYRGLFPGVQWDRDAAAEMITSRGGGRLATSTGGTLTGRGADMIVIDDPLNASEAASEAARKRVNDWYGGALVSRLNDKQSGSIVVVAQRLHEDDLPGHLLAQGGWNHLDLPAIAVEDQVIELGRGRTHRRSVGDVLHPEREPLTALDAVKREIGSLMFSAQYQQRPTPLEGNIVKRAWVKPYQPHELPKDSTKFKVVQSWDVATQVGDKNDYSVGTTWLAGRDDVYLVDVFRARLEFPAVRRAVIEHAQRFKCDRVLIEDAGPGKNLLQDLWSAPGYNVLRPIGVRPEGSKVERMEAQSPKIEAGHVHVPADAPWLAEFLAELLGFPKARHDDQVDSVSQFLLWWQSNRYDIGMTFAMPIIISRGPRRFP